MARPRTRRRRPSPAARCRPSALLGRTLSAAAQLRARIGKAAPPREELIARHVAGRSFVDVGCMWTVHGALCFAAEDAGASSVTGVDVMAPTERFEAERARRGSRMRFVGGDLHEPATIAEIGAQDVVWCSGVLYHAPHPLLTLERLREITGHTLLLATETVADTPGRRNTCVIAPGRDEHPNSEPATGPGQGFGPWYWGISPSALRTMLQLTGFQVVEEHRTPFHVTVVAR
ncbi:MAG TPA: methyltransferase domain-containing protein [Solirubrobacteraceae bacterium]|nr:methyltransferase domain-containing protein [Solirubrobacteraceae bacterium]